MSLSLVSSINEYGAEGLNAKSDALYKVAKQFVASKVPLDGIGFQSHFYLGTAPPVESLRANMQRFADLGLQVAVTELDINLRRSGIPIMNDTTEAYNQQAKDYKTVVAGCMRVNQCRGVVSIISHDHPFFGAEM
jgi:GH35 family endo-1,4-beta-xylanase